jgi:hypothetical protein
MAKGLCFLLIKRRASYIETISSIRDCFADDAIVKVNLSHITDSSILDYLTLWSVPDNHYIYLLDDVNEAMNNYSCRRFTIKSAHDEYYRLNVQLLSAYVAHNVRCGPDDKEYLVCFQKPVIVAGSCPGRMFKCSDQSCISDFNRCDSQDDCPSGDDEQDDCPAPSGDDGQDSNTACSLDDAAYCVSHTSILNDICGDLYFHCGVGDCINIALVSCISINSHGYTTRAFCLVNYLKF